MTLCASSSIDFVNSIALSCLLSNLVNDVIKSIDEGRLTLGVFIDFKKACDTIDHSILCGKLERYGIKGLLLTWFKKLFAR